MIKRSLNVSMVFFLLFSIFCGVIIVSPSPAQAATSYLAAMANGNLTDSTTWQLIDTTSYLDNESNQSALTTSYVTSSAFTPGAITCDGIAVKIFSRATSPTTQTFTVSLYNSSDSVLVSGTEVTIKVSDVPPASTSVDVGWVFFKWGSPVTLTAGKSYKVQAKTSSGSMINIYRDGTAGNWSRYLRTTTAQAPVAGDVMHIQREYTGSATGTSYTVTMNQTASTDYGVGTDGTVAMTIGNGCHLTYGTSAATNYYLKLSGNLIVYSGGYLDIGTTGTAIPRDSTAVLEFDPVADGGMGLLVQRGGFLNMQGLSRTSGKNIVSCKLNTDEAIGQTVLGVDADTGWLNGDEIGIATTTRTYSECERRTLSGNATATELTVGSALTYAHSGTSPTQAEVINITRNVKFRSATSTLMTYAYFKATSVTDIDWAEFYYIGEAAAGKYGITVETTTGSFNMQYSSLHDTEDYGFYAYIANLNNLTFSNNVTYNTGTATANYSFYTGNTNKTSIIFDSNIFMYSPLYNQFYMYNAGFAVNNCTFTGVNASPVNINGGSNSWLSGAFSFDNNVFHGNNGGLSIVSMDGGTISNCKFWRNNNYGLVLGYSALRDVTISNCSFTGNASYNVYCSAMMQLRTTFNSCSFNGEVAYPTTRAIYFTYDSGMLDCVFNNCTFGTVVAHTTDIETIGPYKVYLKITMNNCTLASPTEVSGNSYWDEGSYIKSYNHDLGGTTKIWVRNGQVDKETTIFKTATPSFKQTPSSTTVQQAGEKWLIPCDSGELVTVKIWSRWDSANTPSTKPQVKLNGCGIVESVGTNTSATTVWEQLTVSGVPTSDGVVELVPYSLKSSSATLVYWDDISISYAGGGVKETGGLKYWFESMPKYVYYALQNISRSWGVIIGN